jgi:DNA polymerase-3 subunit alpha
MSTFRSSSIFRELGKVYGLPKREIDILSDYPHKADKNSPIIARILHVAEKIQDFPNHRSIHAGGVLISEAPIYRYSALDLPPVGLPTVQWDMYISEDIGFEKFDILSQRGIGHIKDAADLVWKNRQVKVDVHDVASFKKDPLIKQQLKEANTIGCFYIESPGMRGLLKKLKCDTYIHLVAASSIIRPGVAKSGMMKAYIQRFHNPQSIQYLHPVMEEQLKETYGVMVFQEDVLKVCHHFAGLDLADADVLRRAMSGKFRSKAEFQRIIDKFFAGCKANGHPEEISKEVWRQVESFAGYSFSKAHSASFAVESFQSLFLKTYYPKEFMVAVINNFGGFYKTWVYVTELRKTGVNLHLPCVNESDALTNIKGNDVYLGLALIESLEQNTLEAILKERSYNGPFRDLPDFMERVPVSVIQVKLLIKAGAFGFVGLGKKQLMWQAHMGLKKAPVLIQDAMQAILFERPHKEYVLPSLVHNNIEDAYDEIELLGFPVSMTDFELLDEAGSAKSGEHLAPTTAQQLPHYLHQHICILGNYVTTKGVKTSRGDMMAFGTFYDVENNFFDTTHFSASLKQYPFAGRGVYRIEGRVVVEFGFYSIEVERMEKLATKPDPRY